MNIIKYLRKAKIETRYKENIKEFTFYKNGKCVKLKQKDIEQYLFICLVDLIDSEI